MRKSRQASMRHKGKQKSGGICSLRVFIFVVLLSWMGFITYLLKTHDKQTTNVAVKNEAIPAGVERFEKAIKNGKLSQEKLKEKMDHVVASTKLRGSPSWNTVIETTSDDEPVTTSFVNPYAGKPTKITFYRERLCQGSTVTFDASNSESFCEGCISFCEQRYDNLRPGHDYHSFRVEGEGEVDLYNDCDGHKESHYLASAMPQDGCIQLHSWPKVTFMRFVESSLFDPNHQKTPKTLAEIVAKAPFPPEKNKYAIAKFGNKPKANKATYRIVYSAESSHYFGYQAQANYYAFMFSMQEEAGGSWTRLMTARSPTLPRISFCLL